MSSPLRASALRAAAGGVLLVAAASVLVFLLPDASGKRSRQARAAREAAEERDRQAQELAALQDLSDRIKVARSRMDTVLAGLPQEGTGTLTWALSRTLHDLAAKHGVRLQAVKYGQPSREGTKGTDLEALDVEFTVVGLYPALKPFMLDLESSPLPFGLGSAKLEETPEGARLIVGLRAFRRTGKTVSEEEA